MFDTILVPVDGSDHSLKSAEIAGDIASKFGARLVLLHVMERAGSGRVPRELQEFSRLEHVQVSESDALHGAANEILENARQQTQAAPKVETIVRVGDPAKSIIDQVSESEADLIVMGRRGLGDLSSLLLGSVSHKVAHLADCACLTVK